MNEPDRKLSRVVVAKLFEQRAAEALGDPTLDLPRDEPRIDDAPDIVQEPDALRDDETGRGIDPNPGHRDPVGVSHPLAAEVVHRLEAGLGGEVGERAAPSAGAPDHPVRLDDESPGRPSPTAPRPARAARVRSSVTAAWTAFPAITVPRLAKLPTPWGMRSVSPCRTVIPRVGDSKRIPRDLGKAGLQPLAEVRRAGRDSRAPRSRSRQARAPSNGPVPVFSTKQARPHPER